MEYIVYSVFVATQESITKREFIVVTRVTHVKLFVALPIRIVKYTILAPRASVSFGHVVGETRFRFKEKSKGSGDEDEKTPNVIGSRTAHGRKNCLFSVSSVLTGNVLVG